MQAFMYEFKYCCNGKPALCFAKSMRICAGWKNEDFCLIKRLKAFGRVFRIVKFCNSHKARGRAWNQLSECLSYECQLSSKKIDLLSIVNYFLRKTHKS